MRITTEIDIRDFQFWSGGRDRAKDIKCDEDWDAIESLLEDIYPDGMTDTQLNDIFWFDFDSLAQACGYENEEHYFYGAAKDEDEMSELLREHFPDADEDAVDEWCNNEWDKNRTKGTCFEQFESWYAQYCEDNEDADDGEDS